MAARRLSLVVASRSCSPGAVLGLPVWVASPVVEGASGECGLL